MLRGLSIFISLLMLFFSVFNPSIVYSYQENPPEIYVYVDRISDETAIKAHEFMTTLKDKLTKSNVTVKFTSIQNSFLEADDKAIAVIRFEPIFDRERIIQDYAVGITATPKKLKEISPILENPVGISTSLSSPMAAEAVYAMIMLSLNRCDLAMSIFTSLKTSDTDLSNLVNYNRATCYLLEGDYKKSIDLYKNLLYGETPRFLGVNLAWLYLKTGQENEAFDLMNHATEIAQMADEGVDKLLAVRAQLHNLVFRYDNAINDLNAAIELSPHDSTLYVLRGQTYLLLYEWDKAAADYNKAIELDPTYADAYFFRGVLYYSILQTGQAMYTDALTDFQYYLELAPDGDHAAEATRYSTDIQTQINALNN